MQQIHRRGFIGSAATAASAIGTLQLLAQAPKSAPSQRVRVGCMGVGGRASNLISAFSSHPESVVVAVADIDSRRLPEAVERISKNQGSRPEVHGDFRKLIDHREIDAIVVGTPDHWHAIPTILACQAGKDVYVEKPDGHNIVEGQRMVAAQKKHARVVQLGTQSRSSPHFLSAIEFIRSGKLGKCLVAKAWESARQRPIGKPADTDPPPGVDYDMWLGAAPWMKYNPARFHGNWRWWFELGTGDLGNDGVHRLDVARWALSTAIEAQGGQPLGLPHSVCSTGGKWYFDDLQEWPDTLSVTYEFSGQPGCMLTYEMRLNTPYNYLDEAEGAVVFGDQAYIILGNQRWRAYGPKNQLIEESKGDYDDIAHVQNFIDCIKSRERTNADLETVGHPSSVLCHAGNISWRVGRKLILDSQAERFVMPNIYGKHPGNVKQDPSTAMIPDEQANAFCSRPKYRGGTWLLPEV